MEERCRGSRSIPSDENSQGGCEGDAERVRDGVGTVGDAEKSESAREFESLAMRQERRA